MAPNRLPHVARKSLAMGPSARNLLLTQQQQHQQNQHHHYNHHQKYHHQLDSNQFNEERQDVIFRKVRGILNKITPETFDKLSKELVNVGLDSPKTLRGVIYLLFDKALKDLKYSSLYAKLCQELSEKAPNFEQEPGPNTFCKFLISKCEDEFERRRKATEDYDAKNELTDEEYEQKAIAKQKMLGNIKFICELGKKRLLQEEILHECIRGLLSKKKERPIQDQAQDLECLCQIMRTIGSLLDIQASKNLMNQYFERIDMFSQKPELPSRIRFMLKDVIDLRNNNWRPRPFLRDDNVPQTLSKLREEAGYDPAASGSSAEKFGNNRNILGLNDLSKLHGNKLSMLLDDDGPSFTTSSDFHWGPSHNFLEQSFDPFAPTKPTGTTTSSPAILKSTPPASTVSLSNTAQNLDHPVMAPTFHKSPMPFHPSQCQLPFDSDFNVGRFDRSQPPPAHLVNSTNITSSKHRDVTKKIIEGLVSEKRPFLDTNSVIKRNDREHTTNISTRATNATRSTLIEDPFNGPRRNVGSRTEQQHSAPSVPFPVRGGNVSPILRRTPIRRHIPQESGNHGPPQTSSNALHPSQMHQNYRNDAKSSIADQHENRDPRFHRPDPLDHEQHRYHRFSNNVNYRHARNDRPNFSREHHHFEPSNQQPESELNLNWRSGPPTSVSTTSSLNSSSSNTSNNANVNFMAQAISKRSPFVSRPINTTTNNSNNQFTESKIESDKPTITNNITANSQFNEPSQGLDEQSRSDRRPLADKNCGPVHHEMRDSTVTSNYRAQSINSKPLTTPPRIDAPISRFGTESMNRQQPTPVPHGTHPASRPPPRRILLEPNQLPSQGQNQNYRYNPRNAHTHSENFDKRGTRKFHLEHSQDQDHPHAQHHHHHQVQATKFSSNGPPHQEPNNYRSSLRKDQPQSENTILNEAEKTPNWRKGTSVAINNLVKDQMRENPNQFALKPPSKVSDPNFSLRPSHNLVGRLTGMSAISFPFSKSCNQMKPSASDNNLVLTNENKDVHELRASMKPVARFQSEGATFISSVSSNASKTGPESSAGDGGEERVSKLSNESPIRVISKEVHIEKFMSALTEYINESPQNTRVAAKVKELKIPRSCQHDCLVATMKQSIQKSDQDRDNVCKIFVQLIPSIFETSTLLNAFKIIFEQMHALEVEIPKVKSLVAGFLSQAVYDGLMALEDISSILSGGKHHPLFLLFLQKLEKKAGQAWLSEKFLASKIILMDMLPEADRTKDRLTSILKDRCLGFLDPMLTIEPDLWEQMKERDPSPAGIYRWVKDNVDQTIQNTPTFAHVLITCLLKYIHNFALEKSKSSNQEQRDDDNDSDKSSPSTLSQSTIDIETEMLTKYQQVLQAWLKDKQLQLATLYALQSFYHGLDFPKGSLLRWFHMLYDKNVVDDDVFFVWKEEINDEFPGKGQALFQVNTWLNWLAEAESEEEEDCDILKA